MRPETTFLTSSELQTVLGNELSEAEMDELQAFRDQVLDRFRDHIGAVNAMEDVYGKDWRSLDVRLWICDGIDESISSPILLQRDDEDTVLFEAFQMLGKHLIRDRPPASELAGEGSDQIDALAALLAQASLREEMEADAFDALMDAVRGNDRLADWDAVAALAEAWAGDTGLFQWVENR